MKNNKIIRAIGGIDDELIERAAPQNKKANNKITPWFKWALPIAACFILMAVITIPVIFKNPTPDYGIGDVPSAASLDEIFGLPTSGCTSDGSAGASFDRILLNNLRLLMRSFNRYNPDDKAVFAIVKITSTEQFKAKTNSRDSYRGDYQIAESVVIYDVIGDEVIQPFKIRQYLYGGCMCDEPTNLLRAGGVYALPLVKNGNSDEWTLYGDLDVLFEVDDKGLINSHSHYEQFTKYDGQKLEALWNDIEYLYMNPILFSRFAEEILWGSEIVVDSSRITLHNPITGWYGWTGEDAGRFDARIGADGRIEIDTNEFNIFRPVEGMTVDEVQAEISRIQQFVDP